MLILATVSATSIGAQSLAVLQGRVYDAHGAVVPHATVRLRNNGTGYIVSVESDLEGRYYAPGLTAGSYRLSADAPGFRPEIIQAIAVDVGRTVVRDFHLTIGEQNETVIVTAELPLVDRATATVGHVVSGDAIQDVPLNGQHFIDLGLLVPGSVAPSQNGFSSRPIRGIGLLAFNTAGNREEAVAFEVNGVSTNNLTFGSLIFDPPLESVDEFKVDNSTFGAEHGHVSGGIVNIVTRSGSDVFHGDAFEFFRNDALDARNFFEFTSDDPHPFNRNQFGGSLGGPLWRNRTFFLGTYDGVRQQQGVDLNSLVLTDAQRALPTDPVTRQLIALIPRANYFDAAGTPRFVGSAPAEYNADRWSADVTHTLAVRDRLHGFVGRQPSEGLEPTAQGNSIPGFGSARSTVTGVLTLNETHTFSSSLLNEVRFGRTTLSSATRAAAPLNPVELGIRDGVTQPIGLPQIIVAGDLNFGGPAPFPQGRDDVLYVVGDTLTKASGRHTIKAGGEYRHFINSNVAQGSGVFNFPSVAAFLAGTANGFTITLGERRSVIDEPALSLFSQDAISVGDRLTVELGLRYEWHVTPTERDNRFVVFDPSSVSLLRVGVDTGELYRQNKNVEPRVGVAWTLSQDGRTVLRAAYRRAADQPVTAMARDTANNPPYGVPVTGAGSISLVNAIDTTRPAGLAPVTIDPNLRNATMQSWNANLQRQLGLHLAATIGYLGSHGSNLRISRNLNQPLDGVRPFAALSSSSPILPGIALGNITQAESTGFSNYHAALISVTQRLSRGLQVDASYVYSKSLDTNSLNSSNFDVQNAYDIPNQYGLSDFDARHRFVLTTIYALPFTGTALTRGWQIAAVVQSQSGNPVNIVTSNSALTGVPNTVRPDATGPITIIGSVDRWFDPSVFTAVNRFGNLGRNVVIGPSFHNTDLSVIKNLGAPGRLGVQLRADVFDLFNHPNFGQPNNIVGSPTFGAITRTRLPTGEAGSSRQIQLGARLSF
jgi:Carboxypeptidase regulatory-like domain/TonB dependent receptor-like, beta-barrel